MHRRYFVVLSRSSGVGWDRVKACFGRLERGLLEGIKASRGCQDGRIHYKAL